jgi:tetratricopeptide (TPR) repeat protein
MELRTKLCEKFASKLNIIEQEADTIWKKGELYHVYYTLHGLDHSNNVITILDELINGLNPQDNLNETEFFCLLSAAFLHDVGMQCKYPNDIERAAQISTTKKRPYTFQDLIRDEHHKRSGRYIKDNYKNLKLDTIEAECVRLISEGHRQTKLESTEYIDQPIGHDRVRIRLLSALLRLADELDIGYKRAPETLLDILKNDIPDYSRVQWLKHYYTSGILINTQQETNGKKKTFIEIHCQYPDKDVGRKITEVLISKPIEETLNDVRLILLEYGLNLILDHKIKYNPDLEEIPEIIYEYLGQKLKISMEIPRTKGFVGRKEELKDLLSSLDKNIIVIEGIAGIGKSYVAARFADELKDEYTVFWYESLSEVSTLSSVMNKISIFLKENGKPKLSNFIEDFGYDNEVLITLLKEEFNSNNYAIFFDNYHKAEKELNPLLKQLVSLKSSKIIIITREEPEFYNVVDERENRVAKIKIDAWDFAHTKMMLEARDIEATDEILEKIHELLHGHPQYLNLFSILAKRSTAKKLLENLPTALKDAHEYLEKEVYNSLTSDEKLLIQTISVFRIPETADAFDSVNKFKDLNQTLDSLIHKFLVNEIGINTFSVHDIMRDYCLNDVGKRKTLRNYYVHAAEYFLSSDDDPERILEAAYHFDNAGMKEKSAEIIINNAGNFISKGFWHKTENQLKIAIKSFQRKTQFQAIQLISRANYEIGRLYFIKGDYDLALNHVKKSLIPFNKFRNTLDTFNSYNLLFGIFREKNEIEKAKEYNEKCLKIAEKEKDGNLKAVAMGNFGLLLEDKDESLDNYMKSLTIFENNNDLENIATACSNIAEVYSKLGNYKKSYDFIKRALELEKELNNFFEIANIKEQMAMIYYSNPKKPARIDLIINCLKEASETYEKIGYLRGNAKVHGEMGQIYFDEKDFKSAIEHYQIAAKIYYSLKQQSEAEKICLQIAISFYKLKDFYNAKLFFEKKLDSRHHKFEDKLSLAEIYLILGAYNEAFNLLNKLIIDDIEEESDKWRYLVPLFLSISLILLNKVDDAYDCLKKIGEVNNLKSTINWDFSDIELVLDKTGESKQFFTDAITLLKCETNYPIIRLKDVRIINDEMGKQAEIFHPFTGSLIITKADKNLKEIMQKLSYSNEIDFDTPEIMEIEHNKALLTLGFLFKKGFLDCRNIDRQKFDLKLTERGIKILKLSKAE